MKLVLFCLVGTAAAASGAAPVNEVSPSNEITATRDTHGWSPDHISLAADTNNDHNAHSAVFYPHEQDVDVAKIHLKDPRTHGGSGKNKLTLPTRHTDLGNTAVCDKIVCLNVERDYNGISTSSIVVEHKCGGHAGSDTEWGARFSSNRTSVSRMQVHSDPHAACKETKCTQGHVCGLVAASESTAPVCQCHSLSTAYTNTAADGGTTTTYIPSINTVYSTTVA